MTKIIRVTKCADCPIAVDALGFARYCIVVTHMNRDTNPEKGRIPDPETIPDWCPLESGPVSADAQPSA